MCQINNTKHSEIHQKNNYPSSLKKQILVKTKC